eukprot:SM000010S04280  [mRNA]  locus=s10:608890:611039:- [translate_table: standard]
MAAGEDEGSSLLEAPAPQAMVPEDAAQVARELRMLEPDVIHHWSTEHVVQEFLNRLDLSYLADTFQKHRVTGRVLMQLTEEHLREMGISCLGDRLSIMENLAVIKHKKIEAQRNAPLWVGRTPARGCAYNHGILGWLRRELCPCCIAFTSWRITQQGIRWTTIPAPIVACCDDVDTSFIDFRFLKDIELDERNPQFLCCCQAHQAHKLMMLVRLYASQHDERNATEATISILHPEASEVERVIRTAWADARLVAD